METIRWKPNLKCEKKNEKNIPSLGYFGIHPGFLKLINKLIQTGQMCTLYIEHRKWYYNDIKLSSMAYLIYIVYTFLSDLCR